jgi:hypothetical protein
MKVNENTIIYAAVAWRHKLQCKVISDTLNEDPIFRDTVYEVLSNMHMIETENFFVYKNK